MKKLNKKFDNENGSALVIVMMVLVVVSALGGALGMVTINSHRLAEHTQDTNSAYYIAEAGANMAYEEIKNKVQEGYEKPSSLSSDTFFKNINPILNNFEGNYSDEFEEQSGNQPTAHVTIVNQNSDNNSKKIIIKSIGEVGQKTRTVEKNVKLNWIPKKNNGGENIPYIPPNSSLVIQNYINFNGGTISGDIHISSSIMDSFRLGESGEFKGNNIYTNYSGNLEDIYIAPAWRVNNPDSKYTSMVNKTKNETISIPWENYFEMVETVEYPNEDAYSYFPDDRLYKDSNHHDVIKDGNILVNNYMANNYILEFNGNQKAKKLEIESNRNLKIKTNNKNVTLVVNELNIPQGNIEIIDNGTLNLYVMNKFTFGGDSKINSKGAPGNFNLFYAGNNDLTLGGNQYINGGIHIKQANLILTRSGNLKGPILSNGETVKINGGSINNMLLFAPKADVTIDEGGVVHGTIVANQFKLDGGGSVNFQKSNYDIFSHLSNTNEEKESSIDKLLEPGIAIEK